MKELLVIFVLSSILFLVLGGKSENPEVFNTKTGNYKTYQGGY